MAMRTGDKVIIHPDSKYAIGVARGLFFPRENALMAKLLRHLYGVVQRVFDVSLCWTKGHDGDLETCWLTLLPLKAAQWSSWLTGIL